MFHLRALPACLLFLVAGILFVTTDVWWLYILLFGLVAIALVVAAALVPRRKGLAIACLLCLALALVTVARCSTIRADLVPTDRQLLVYGRIAAVQTDGDGQIRALTLDNLRWNGEEYRGKMDVTPPQGVWSHTLDGSQSEETALQVGDWVIVDGTVSTLIFDYYDGNAVHRAIQRRYFRADAQELERAEQDNSTTAVEKVQMGIYRVLRRNMRSQTAGFAFAFMTGNTCFVPQDVLQGFRLAGLSHLMAVSGLHVGVLATVLLWLLRRLRCPAHIKPLVLAAVLGVYVWICNATPSVLRASVLLLVLTSASAIGRNRDAPSVLSLTALGLLAVQPLYLFDISFLLSFAAYMGIMLLWRPLARLFARMHFPAKLGNALGVDLAVSCNIFPLSSYFFGGVSLLAIPVNLVLIPIMSVVYVVLFAGLLLAIIPPLGFVLVAVDYIISGLYYVVGILSDVGFVGTHTAIYLLPVFYAGTAIVSDYCLLSKPVKYAAGSTAIAMCLLASFFA